MPEPKPLKILDKEMSRREFLSYMGAASLGVIGITGLVKGLNGLANKHVSGGYGSSPYGGDREGR